MLGRFCSSGAGRPSASCADQLPPVRVGRVPRDQDSHHQHRQDVSAGWSVGRSVSGSSREIKQRAEKSEKVSGRGRGGRRGRGGGVKPLAGLISLSFFFFSSIACHSLLARCLPFLKQVKASHRWMVSGTPIAGKIDSLHGELNFLQVCVIFSQCICIRSTTLLLVCVLTMMLCKLILSRKKFVFPLSRSTVVSSPPSPLPSRAISSSLRSYFLWYWYTASILQKVEDIIWKCVLVSWGN